VLVISFDILRLISLFTLTITNNTFTIYQKNTILDGDRSKND